MNTDLFSFPLQILKFLMVLLIRVETLDIFPALGIHELLKKTHLSRRFLIKGPYAMIGG
jgi:hypothetical protein